MLLLHVCPLATLPLFWILCPFSLYLQAECVHMQPECADIQSQGAHMQASIPVSIPKQIRPKMSQILVTVAKSICKCCESS